MKIKIKITVNPGLIGWLTMVMVLAKLTGIISWSWWIVLLAPTLITIAVAIIGVVVIIAWEWFH